MLTTLRRGLAAGAVGVTALNAVTYVDMAWRGRPASKAPEQSIERIAERSGHPVPGDGETRANRLTGLGALSGIATGIGVAVAFAALRAPSWLARPLGPLVVGGAAMAATDSSMVALGVSDPRTWSRSDWLADVLPHLAYGAATWAVLNRRR